MQQDVSMQQDACNMSAVVWNANCRATIPSPSNCNCWDPMPHRHHHVIELPCAGTGHHYVPALAGAPGVLLPRRIKDSPFRSALHSRGCMSSHSHSTLHPRCTLGPEPSVSPSPIVHRRCLICDSSRRWRCSFLPPLESPCLASVDAASCGFLAEVLFAIHQSSRSWSWQVSDSCIKDDGCIGLCHALVDCPTLTSLNLSNCLIEAPPSLHASSIKVASEAARVRGMCHAKVIEKCEHTLRIAGCTMPETGNL